tara:strand:- start:439 stop:1701 length:1263 start_codon:yes stop_codon:yes gene_type:complete
MVDLDSWIKHGDEIRRPLIVNHDITKSNKVVIVGAGLSGLCTAFRIAEKRPDIEIILVEKSNRIGGVIETWKQNEWICDVAVNATRNHPAFWRLIDDLGLENKFNSSNPKAKSRWVIINGKKHKLSVFSLLKIGPIKLFSSLKKSRAGGFSVAEVLPNKQIADALTLGIVNDTSENVDADFLIPSITKFGPNPPLKKSKLNSLISKSYPLFKPKKGSLASLDGGMETLIFALENKLSNLPNVRIILNCNTDSPESISQDYGIPESSIIWCAKNPENNIEFTELSVFVIGFSAKSVQNIKLGYGTLIPDKSLPISGILHESDVHVSKRSPEGHRLFRLMVPHNRWDMREDSVLECAEKLLGDNPVLFSKIGQRKIPRYKPGHLSSLYHKSSNYSTLGWTVSGVSITHVVDESERISELFET